MGAYKLSENAENAPNTKVVLVLSTQPCVALERLYQIPKIYLPKLSAQAQKFGISMKKASLGVRSPWYRTLRAKGDLPSHGSFDLLFMR